MATTSTRAYYADSYTTVFDAEIVETLAHASRPAAVLSRTYFYPTSGGQPHDLGGLDGARVVEVVARESDGAVVHVLDAPLPRGPVTGRIDWTRRFDHMQHHTGQHVLSQAFIRVANAATIGFHLGEQYVSIDLDAPALPPASSDDAFELANGIVERDLTVRAWFPTPEELASIALRKTPEVEGALRVVAIGDFDQSACGGTHVARTGEIGLIHHLRTERLKRGTRVSFLCGGRARRDYAAKHAITAQLSAQLTCSVDELPQTVARLQDELVATRREIGRFRDEALESEARELRGSARRSGEHVLIVRAWAGRPAEEIRSLVLKATAVPGTLALLGTGGERAQFVFGRSEELSVDLKPALDAALAAIGGGRGGGSRLVQGGGGPATLAQVEAALGRAAGLLAT